MRLKDLKRLVAKYGEQATLGEVLAAEGREADAAAHAPRPRGIADRDEPGKGVTETGY